MHGYPIRKGNLYDNGRLWGEASMRSGAFAEPNSFQCYVLGEQLASKCDLVRHSRPPKSPIPTRCL